jgi:hypothetical protein
MKKITHFLTHSRTGWPDKAWLEPYFLTRPGRCEAFGDHGGSWGLGMELGLGLIDSATRPFGVSRRIAVDLAIVGHPDLGALLCYQRLNHGGGVFFSKGHLSRSGGWATVYDDAMPVEFCVPFEAAWSAIEQFIETEGALPTSIGWVAGRDLPLEALREPLERRAAY